MRPAAHVVLQVPHAADVPVAQLALELARRQARVLEEIVLHVELRPAGFRDRLGDDRAEHDQRPQRAHAVARRERDLPVVERAAPQSARYGSISSGVLPDTDESEPPPV